MNHPTSTKQYVIEGGDNNPPTPITVTITATNSSDFITLNGYQIGRNIFGITYTGEIQNGSNHTANPHPLLTSGLYGKFGARTTPVLALTADFIAGAFGYDVNTVNAVNTRRIAESFSSNGLFDDIMFNALSGAGLTRINPFAVPPVSNPYEIDSIFVEATSTVDEIIMVYGIISGGTSMNFFCKRKGNKYFDFFMGAGTAYNAYDLTNDNGGVIIGSKICTILGITPISADTHSGSVTRCWYTNTSGNMFTTVGGSSLILDAIYV